MSAQCERAVSRLGKQCYQGYARGLIKDKIALGMCHEMSETFKEAKTVRAELEEEIERDALDGLSLEEAKKADEHRNVTQVGKAKREAKLRLTRFAGRQTVNWNLQNHRDKVKKLSHELGMRALLLHESEPLLEVKGHQTLCELANRLDEDANKKWDEIVAGGDVKGAKGISALSFHTILVQFLANFANFSKGTQLGDLMLRFFKYDSAEQEQRLAAHYEGTEAAVALQAQLNEVEEPDLDIGRELATMEEAYTATPAEWNMEPVEAEAWVPDTGTWGEEETTGAPAAAVSEEASWGSSSEGDWSADADKPAETWSASPSTTPAAPAASEAASDWSSTPAPMAPQQAPRIGQAPPPAPSDDDDWPDMGQPPAPAASAPRVSAPTPAAPPPADPPPLNLDIPDPTQKAPIEISIPTPPSVPSPGTVATPPSKRGPSGAKPPAGEAPPLQLDIPIPQGPQPGDELLPAHLRNRTEEPGSQAPFVPQLPSDGEE